MRYIGIDQSKRSTAIVCLDDEGEMVDFHLVTPPFNLDKEELIHYQWTTLSKFISEQLSYDQVCFALEGAAFAAGGSASDLLWGIQWYIRTRIHVEYPGYLIGIITPATWRSSILATDEQRRFKEQYGGKIGLKHAVVSKLPQDTHEKLISYIRDNIQYINISKGYKPDANRKDAWDALFDLADAWGIARHRFMLSKGWTKPVKEKKPKVKKQHPLLNIQPKTSAMLQRRKPVC